MSRKRIFILDGHPARQSLCRGLAEAYSDAAQAAGHNVRLVHLNDLAFDMDYERAGYRDPKPLEPALEQVMQDIEWCEHLVMVTPMWWGGLPAKLKGLFDRAFLPGRSFDTRVTKLGMPAPMLGGRSARVVLTADTPGWFLRVMYGNAMIRQVRGQILGFVGIKPTRFTYFAAASHPKDGQAQRWLAKVRRIGAQGA
ncbi:NAD(P)H-dependent oxidoreductase [Roseovarius pacificus]|uniref:NAD(P)H-dependent oxidoreductase n=1 Tax=Roseovarius pacificus TaxID=337701 RepID=UPI0029693422|nr:NAD(P)H-dependent oxidoreductase [Roseovarius pacificus]MDW3118397.1 NAD(P)H-dependent oxidoreductase [Roseovarius pacificus]